MNYKENRAFINDISEGWEENKEQQKAIFDKAYKLACSVHENQYRDEGTPYITHIDGILDIFKNELNDLSYNKWIIIALHDVLEDSDLTENDLVQKFGDAIVKKVTIVTKTKGMDVKDYISRMEQYEYNATIIKIKLADRLHNVRSLENIVKTKPDKVKKYVDETKKYYLPLAKKYNIKLYKLIEEELSAIEKMTRKGYTSVDQLN